MGRSENSISRKSLFRVPVLLVLLFLSSCALPSDGILDAAGPLANIQRDHLVRTVLLVLVVIVPLYVLLPVVLWRYRLRKRNGYDPDWRFAWKFEFLIWGIPAVIVAVLAIWLWGTVHRIDPYTPLQPGGEPPLRVQVIGLDWKFLFIYPDEGVASVGELTVPAGREIAFEITADGPMMSFMVPRLGGQIYAMAGMRTQLHLVAGEVGDFRGLNTQFNGSHFHEQKFVLHARSEVAYRAWIERARAAPNLTEASYVRLAQPSTIARPLLFGGTSPELFERVIGKYHQASNPPGPLPGDAPHPPAHGKTAPPVPAKLMP